MNNKQSNPKEQKQESKYEHTTEMLNNVCFIQMNATKEIKTIENNSNLNHQICHAKLNNKIKKK